MQRQLTNSARQLIEQLQRQAYSWSRTSRSYRVLLEELAETGDPLAIPEMTGWLLATDAKVRSAAADGIRRLLLELRPEEFRYLEEQTRGRSFHHISRDGGWPQQLTLERMKKFEGLGELAQTAFSMATFHSSGYVRQAALLGLKEAFDGSELPFLLLRLNDWVPQVRETAAELVRNRLRSNYAGFFMPHLSFIEGLRNAGRLTDKKIIDEIEMVLIEQSGQYALLAAVHAKSFPVQRIAFRLARNSGSLEILSAAFKHPDPIIRAFGVEMLASLEDADESFRLLNEAKNDRHVHVRVKALQVAAERFPERSREWLDAALLDSQLKERSFAQFQLREHMDLRSFYLGAVNSGDLKLLDRALMGLGEVGQGNDSVEALRYTGNAFSKVRRAAIRAVARLAPEQNMKLFLDALADQSPSVSREATTALIKIHYMFSGEMIWNIAKHSRYPHVQRKAVRVIARLRKWESISYLIEAHSSGDEIVRERAAASLRRWIGDFDRTFAEPTPEQATRIRAVLKSNRVSEDLRALIRLDESLN